MKGMETMKLLQSRPMFLSVLLIVMVLVNPTWLMAAADGQNAVAKLQQMRASQNEQTRLTNMKAQSIDVSRKQLDAAGLMFRQALQKNQLHQMPEITASRSPGLHRIDPQLKQYSATADFSPTYEIQNGFSPGSALGITVNGKAADTLLVGSEPFFSIDLGADVEGILVVSWDRNHNGITDSMDVPIDDYEFYDNDMHDLNPVAGIFDFIYDHEMAEGVNYIDDDFVFTVYTTDGSADAAVTFYAEPTPYMVSGTVRDITTNEPLEGVIVWGDYTYDNMEPMPEEDNPDDGGPTIIAISDTAGAYTLFFPDSGSVVIGSWDYLLMTGGLIPEPPRFEFILYDTEIVNFYYREPLARIIGYVTDQTGTPLTDIEVRAFYEDMMGPDGPDDSGDGGDGEFIGFTDETGFYEIGVDPGWFYVEVDGKDLVPDFMIPEGQILEVTETGANIADFTLLIPNSFIAGTVLLDGSPYPDATVVAWNPEFGWNVVWADELGEYIIPVYDPATVEFSDSMGFGGYNLHVFIDDRNLSNPIVQVSENWDVAPGTVDEDILLETVTGGLFGTFYNRENNEPILDGWDVGMQAYNLDNGMFYWASPHTWDGSYEIWLPDGLYEIMAGGMDWYGPPPDTILISGAMVPYDIYLDPVNYQGIFDGRVLDDLTNNPIAGAEINIGNEFWGSHTETDDDGYFHFELPNGYYGYHVFAPGYLDYFGDVDINDNYVYEEILLQELVINGAIGGIVFDGSDAPTGVGSGAPIPDASVFVSNPATGIGFHTMTDMDGQYWFDLPNGIYDIYIEHPDYLPHWDSGLWVSDDTLYYDVPLNMADGFIAGRVYDEVDMYPILDAGVWIVSMDTTDSALVDYWSGVDNDGYFRIPVQNGTYEVHVDAFGYEHAVRMDVVVNYEEVYLDFPLRKREFLGPIIHTVMDQPNDQGRWVRIEFGPEMDKVGDYVAYSIWRMTNTPHGPVHDFIAYIPNRYWQFYSLVAPTLVDSNAYTSPMEYETAFMVTGHYDDWNFVDGGTMWGYSVDNIHPGTPDGFVLTDIGSDYKELAWEASSAPDFQYYELYRAWNGDFEGRSPIATLTGLSYRDEGINPDVGHHYMLKAIDANGNASEGAIVITPSTLSADKKSIPTEYGLSQNYPNPFNPTTLIEFALPEAADVTLEIYNLLGQKVRTLANGHMPAGYFNVVWDGLDNNGKTLSSGTYIYQFKSADRIFTKKMVFMK